MSQEQSPATNGGEEYRVVFDETGGYDCMTCGFAIVRQNGDIAAEIDLRHYGQKPCDYEGSGFVDAKERAEFAAHLICAAINASNASPGCPPPSASCEPDPELTACARSAPRGDFIYLLNAFERASQSDNPSLLDYARKRQTLLDYVSKLETVPSEIAPMPAPAERATQLKLVELLENIIQVRAGVLGCFYTHEQKADEMARLAAEALLVVGDTAVSATPQKWVVWAHEHQAYWPASRCGYVPLHEAGHFTFEEALAIVRQGNYGMGSVPEETMMPAPGRPNG